MIRRIPVSLWLLFLALVGCSNSDDKRGEMQPSGVPVETTVATTTTVAPTTTKPKGLGVSQIHRVEEPGYEGGTYAARVTVFRYRDASILPGYLEKDLANESNKRSVAIEVRVCVTEAPPGKDVTVSWNPWKLGDGEGRSFDAWISWSDSVTTQPLYPDDDRRTSVGTCRRGWIPFEISRNWRPDFVEYNAGEGEVLKWPIRK